VVQLTPYDKFLNGEEESAREEGSGTALVDDSVPFREGTLAKVKEKPPGVGDISWAADIQNG